jgi:hypothetical protein
MALCTVEQVNTDVSALLGDPDLEKYTAAIQLPFFRLAYETVWGVALNNGVQMVDVEATYTLTAGTASLTPATASISNMGEPLKLWERASGSSDDYSEMSRVDSLTNLDSSDSLGSWEWRGDTFYFVAATTDRQLKIEYTASAAAPTSGSIPIDGARLVLAQLTAAMIAQSPLGGQPQLASSYFALAYGPSMTPDASGGSLRLLINPMVKNMLPVTPRRFRSRRTWRSQ